MTFSVSSSLYRLFGSASCKASSAPPWQDTLTHRRSVARFCSNTTFEGAPILPSLKPSVAAPEDGSSSSALEGMKRSYGSAPPPQPSEHPIWTEEFLPSGIPSKRRIFCNRALNMRQVQAVGFDMDYTLSQYRPDTFEALAHKETVSKLVRHFGYPEILHTLGFSWDFMMKGLIIDKKRGSMLKVDRHGYVKVAYHGFRQLSHEERRTIYNIDHQQEVTFLENEYAMIDTLFSLAEAYLYMQLVELKDSLEYSVLDQKSYSEIYRELRAAVDMCHRDLSLKKAVAANPKKFIHYDPLLKDMLEMLYDSGRKVFLATNSLWDYTNVVMNYLIDGRIGAAKTLDWMDYFDVVMVGCAKPNFFLDRGQLFSVDVNTGHLRNTDNGAPICAVDEPSSAGPAMPRPEVATTTVDNTTSARHTRVPGASRQMVFQGGCYKDLHKMLNIESGEQILYVGDHIYGDIVKSKKTIGWRTMLVLPELEHELDIEEHSMQVYKELQLLRQQRDMLDDQIQRYEWALTHNRMPSDPEAYEKNMETLEGMKSRRASLKARHSKLLADHHTRFHPVWGQLLKTGHQNSRFAHEMERFACLYTSHVSNLAFNSPDKSYMARMDYMAHEILMKEA